MSEILEKILDKKNIDRAYQQICLREDTKAENARYFDENWDRIQEQIRQRSYTPQTASCIYDRQNHPAGDCTDPQPSLRSRFFRTLHGFQPDKNCEMAVCELLRLRGEGYLWVVDIGLQNFYENEPEDRLMSLVHNIIHDGDTESLIRKYLKAGIMTQCTNEQETSLPVLLMNVLLNELDKELENRGLRFVRCADDCVVAVKSESNCKAGDVFCDRLDSAKAGLWRQRSQNKNRQISKAKVFEMGIFYRHSGGACALKWQKENRGGRLSCFL